MPAKRDATLAEIIGSSLRKLRQKKFPGVGGVGRCAAAFGVTQPYWSSWENAKKVPGDENQRKLAEFFEVPVSRIRGEEPPPPECPYCRAKDAVIEDLKLQVLMAAHEKQRLTEEVQSAKNDALDAMRLMVRATKRADGLSRRAIMGHLDDEMEKQEREIEEKIKETVKRQMQEMKENSPALPPSE